jgi:CheY-like chemotaxis protein
VVRILLGIEEAGDAPWPIGRALLVDADEWVRRVIAAQIERAGGLCHNAPSYALGLRTLERDPDIAVAIVDYDVHGGGSDSFLAEVRNRYPGVRIIGTSGSDRSLEFGWLGVNDFLMKPWVVGDLIGVLLECVSTCPGCGVPLPLQSPSPGSIGSRWHCACCGSAVFGGLDRAGPPQLLINVTPPNDAANG